MKKKLLTEEIKRMQELSGIQNEVSGNWWDFGNDKKVEEPTNELAESVKMFVRLLENFKPQTPAGKSLIGAILESDSFLDMKNKANRLGENKSLSENEENSDWETSIINADEVEDYLDYLSGWDLQYETPVDLGNGKFSIYREKENQDVMNRMNHKDMEERLSDMNDPNNFYD